MKRVLFTAGLLMVLFFACDEPGTVITMESLLNEMTDLESLCTLPETEYKTIQYSSYDRRSVKPSDSCWFANEDGFGNEPVPGFEKVLKQPDSTGIGEYLICDVKQPGAIQRLWTAAISGNIRLYLDDLKVPVFEGKAQDFFWNTIEALSGDPVQLDDVKSFRQFDASYFPVPFAKRCRIEWIGNLKETHFYHVGIRIYDPQIKVKTFNRDDISIHAEKLLELNETLSDQPAEYIPEHRENESYKCKIAAGSSTELLQMSGAKVIRFFSVKTQAEDMDAALRKNIISMYFDNASVPQVQAPLGDFFGSAPGLNPYHSLPFSVTEDSTMICRFVMPFRQNVRIEIENNAEEEVTLTTLVQTADYKWIDGKSMHFYARWKIDHDLTASNMPAGENKVNDIVYLMAMGKGRLVGTAAFIYNPATTPTSWGNWWGEGDEKITVDQDTFPSFFGTGSEDYFNYSWSQARIFSYPYCGQPRNDGPGNRGHVSNFRWHISDDILFSDKLAFFMELWHHDVVPGFSYGRIVYFYALPGLIDDYRQIKNSDIHNFTYQQWYPKAYCGSANFRFEQAESLIPESKTVKLEKSFLWAGDGLIVWEPVKKGEQIKFRINSKQALDNTRIGLTLSHGYDGGSFSVLINGKPVRFEGKEILNLYRPHRTVSDNHFSETIHLNHGDNEIIFENRHELPGRKVGIDFIWILENRQ